jgi:hypothetical protein
MSWWSYRRVFVLRWVSVDLSKRGASVSVGLRGALRGTVDVDYLRTPSGYDSRIGT